MNVVPYSRRGVKRSRTSGSRSRMPVSRIPRSIRYNGENKITRSLNINIPFSTTGFGIGAAFFNAINIVYDPTSVTFYGNSTTFNSVAIPNAAEISALYDQMRIDKVEITWSSTQQALVGTGTGTYCCPKFLVCNDSNDGIGTANITEIQQQPNKCFYTTDGSSFKWTCKPKYQRVVYQTALVSNYEPATGFVNANSTIPHYGTKMAISNLASFTGGTGGIDFDVKLFLTLKNVK